MASRTYLNFDLLVEQETEGHFQARVTGSPQGDAPSVRFTMPFNPTALENLLLKLDPGRSGTRRTGGDAQQQATRDFGGPLYRAIFKDDVLLAWTRSLDFARQQEAHGLRLRLRLNEAPALAGLPWELLYDARTNSFIAQSERTPIVRYLDIPQVPRPLAVNGPLHVLAVISSPIDLPELDVESEWRLITEALQSRVEAGLVVVDRLPNPGMTDLGLWLRRHETHVIHFVGHGEFDDRLGEGVVYFQDRHGRSTSVTSSVLGPQIKDHDPLRMVVLNACRSARADALDPFAGIAQGLVQQDATAVVAMQFPISDRAALTFTGDFYGAVVDGLPVDQAVSCARKALLAEFGNEWATPVLFLRSPDGNIFDKLHSVEPPPVVAPLEPPPVEPPPVEPPHEPPPVEPPLVETPLVETPLVETPLVEPAPVEPAPVEPPPPAPPAPEPSPPEPSPPEPSPPAGPAAWGDRLLDGVRSHALQTGAAVLVGVAAIAVVLGLGGDGGDGGGGNDGGGDDGGDVPALTDTQLMVAAGPGPESLRIWLVDTEDGSGIQQLSDGATREWLPSLAPDRASVVYSRATSTPADGYELRTTDTSEDGRDEALFDPPEECTASTGRPAWSATEPLLVVPCKDLDDVWSLLLLDLEGEVQKSYAPQNSAGVALTYFNDVTLSPDGDTIVLWASTEAGSMTGGALYAIDVDGGDTRLLLDEEEPGSGQYSDAVFSPDGQRLAFRSVVDDGNYDIFTAPFSVDQPLPSDPVRLTFSPQMDEDPTFSPDGSQIAFSRTLPGGGSQLYVVDAAGGEEARPLLDQRISAFERVPAWSHR